MKILLIYPRMPETCWNLEHEFKLAGYEGGLPPLGLLTVASMLPDNWDKKLVDVNIEDLEDADIQWADYILSLIHI